MFATEFLISLKQIIMGHHFKIYGPVFCMTTSAKILIVTFYACIPNLEDGVLPEKNIQDDQPNKR